MKNIQVIDGANNAAYDIYQATEEEFALIFPGVGQDIQFVEDLAKSTQAQVALSHVWPRLIDKKSANGVHGTLFVQLEWKKRYYPNRRERDLTLASGRPAVDW